MKKLSDRVAVVTGAAGGIGRATSVALAKEGCRLALCDVNEAGLEETAALVRELGRTVSTHIVDVSNKERMRRFADEVVEQHGAVHILVNNAGVTVTAPSEHSIETRVDRGHQILGVIYGAVFLPQIRRPTRLILDPQPYRPLGCARELVRPQFAVHDSVKRCG